MNKKSVSMITALILGSALMFDGCVKNWVLPESPSHPSPDSAISLDISNFDLNVSESGSVAVVEFYSAHCSVCAGMGWVIDSLAQTFGDSIFFGAVNTDEDSILWRRYSISTVPTFLLFSSGVLMERRSYLSPDSAAFDTLSAMLRKLIAGNLVTDTSDTNLPPDTIPDAAEILDSINFSAKTSAPGLISMVDFFSPTCGACQRMDSVVANLADRYSGTALIGKINVLQNNTVKSAFNVTAWPTFIFLNGGQEARRIVGVTPEDSLAAIIDSLLATVSGL